MFLNKLIDKIRLTTLALTGKADHPRWLRERDEARDEIDRYRRAANLSLGEFIGAEAAVERIENRFHELEERIRKMKGQYD